jgi:hypothetical protein
MSMKKNGNLRERNLEIVFFFLPWHIFDPEIECRTFLRNVCERLLDKTAS